MTMPTIYDRNRERCLHLVNGEGRIVYVPQNWCDEFNPLDADDVAGCIYCWHGNEDCLAFRSRSGNEWLTTDAQAWYEASALEAMREVSEQEARAIDPDLFTLLDAVDSGVAA